MAFSLWAALALLLAEYAALNVAFESHALTLRTDGWAAAGSLGWLAILVVCAAAGVGLVLHAGRLRIARVRLARPVDSTVLALLGLHGLAFCALWAVSARLFAPAGPPAGSPAAWLSLWGTIALACLLLAVAAALPRASWLPLARALLPALAAGLAIGTGAWVAGVASARLWWPLGPMTLRAVGLALDAVLYGAVSDPSRALIGSDRFQVIVAPACSGFEGVGLMVVFVTAYLVLGRRRLRFPQALLLLPLAVVGAWLANVLRLTLLVLIGTFVSADVAAGGFHARAGWLLFCGVALSLVLVVQRSRFFARESAAVAEFEYPAAPYVVPFMVLVTTALLTGLAATSFDVLYGLRVVATAAVLVAFRRRYRDVDWSWSWVAVAAGLLAAVVFVTLSPRPDPSVVSASREALAQFPAWGQGTWLFFRIVGAVLIVPLAEELAFRGYLLRRLVDREFERVPPGQFSFWALLVSSAAFGGIHHAWMGGFVAGLLYGLVQVRGGTIGHAALAHVVSNAAITVYVLGFGQWWLWA